MEEPDFHFAARQKPVQRKGIKGITLCPFHRLPQVHGKKDERDQKSDHRVQKSDDYESPNGFHPVPTFSILNSCLLRGLNHSHGKEIILPPPDGKRSFGDRGPAADPQGCPIPYPAGLANGLIGSIRRRSNPRNGFPRREICSRTRTGKKRNAARLLFYMSPLPPVFPIAADPNGRLCHPGIRRSLKSAFRTKRGPSGERRRPCRIRNRVP